MFFSFLCFSNCWFFIIHFTRIVIVFLYVSYFHFVFDIRCLIDTWVFCLFGITCLYIVVLLSFLYIILFLSYFCFIYHVYVYLLYRLCFLSCFSIHLSFYLVISFIYFYIYCIILLSIFNSRVNISSSSVFYVYVLA